MKITIYRRNDVPLEVEGDRLRVMCGLDHFEMREQDGLLVRIEEHDARLEHTLAVFPGGGNIVRLKGGLR